MAFSLTLVGTGLAQPLKMVVSLRVRPGTVLFRANLALQPYGYRLGPDPASSGVATIGGVIANNASGMCCGTVENSYQTLESISFLLPSGTYIDTAAPDAENLFALQEPQLAAGLLQIKREIEQDPGWSHDSRRNTASRTPLAIT